MKRLAGWLIAVVWIVGGTLTLSRWWMRHPDSFPTALHPLIDYLFAGHEDGGAETLANAEVAVVLATSLAVVLALTLVFWLLWRVLRRN